MPIATLTNGNTCLISLSISGPNAHLNPSKREEFKQTLAQLTSGKIGVGGYLEERNLYSRSAAFDNRVIHLGIDIWVEAGAIVFAIADGEIHSFSNNNKIGDYGPTIIVKHTISNEIIYALYGHLSIRSLEGLSVGKKLSFGDKLGFVGSYQENGNWEPHLHFQLIKNIGTNRGDYPGVCSKANVDYYKKNCPNPNVVLKLDCLL